MLWLTRVWPDVCIKLKGAVEKMKHEEVSERTDLDKMKQSGGDIRQEMHQQSIDGSIGGMATLSVECLKR